MSKKHWEKSSFFRINFDIFRNKIGMYRHFFWEFPDRFFGHFSGFFVSWPNLTRPQSSLTTSLLWRERCDGKEESDGESHPLFSLPITLLPQCALRSKTTDDESDAGTNYPGGQSRPNSPVSLVQYCNCLIGWQNWSSGDSQKRSFEEILVSNQGQTRNRLDQDQVARLGETAVFWAGCAFVSCQDSRWDSL